MSALQSVAKPEYEFLPLAMLITHYQDQKKILGAWGVTLPPEDELFHEDCPLWVKVRFFDWVIREGLEA